MLGADLLNVAGHAVESDAEIRVDVTGEQAPTGAIDVSVLGQWAQRIVHGTDGNAWTVLR